MYAGTTPSRTRTHHHDVIKSSDGPWACLTCTFVNQDSLHLTCVICGEPRVDFNLDEYKDESNLQQEKPKAVSVTSNRNVEPEAALQVEGDSALVSPLTVPPPLLPAEELENDQERPGAYSVTRHEQAPAVIQRQTTGFISPHPTLNDNTKTLERNEASSQKSCSTAASYSSSSIPRYDSSSFKDPVLFAEVVNENELEQEIRQRVLQEQNDKPNVEEQVRQRIFREAVQAEVVNPHHANDGCTSVSTNDTTSSCGTASLRRSSIKQHLFGDSRKSHIDIASSPEAIRTRTLLPWSVCRNDTTTTWIASVNTNQKALEANNTTTAAKGLKTLSFASDHVAQQAALQMAPPCMLPFSENQTCHICKAKFAVFRRPCHCRNCGVCVCSACATTWPAKTVPSTYNVKNNQSVNVCLACDWLSTSFRTALLEGQYDNVMNLYKTGNINLASPFANIKGENLYPVHCATIGGNLKLLKWLVDKSCCPIQCESRGGGTGPILTSKGRSLLGIALASKRVDFIHYLVVEKSMTFADERDLDVALALESFTTFLVLVPEEIVDPTVEEDELISTE